MGGSVGMMLANPAASVEQYNEDADEIEGLRRQLAAARAALEEERHRNRWLYYAWLPSPTAQAIAAGQPAPEAGRPLEIKCLNVTSSLNRGNPQFHQRIKSKLLL